jgi:hypothetical protein
MWTIHDPERSTGLRIVFASAERAILFAGHRNAYRSRRHG